MRWEYATVEFVAAGFEDAGVNENYRAVMNQYGADGWELTGTATYRSPAAGGTDAIILFFRRPLEAPPAE